MYLQDRGLASATVHKFARSIKAFLNFLVREEVLDASPMRKEVAMPKLEKKALNRCTTEDAKVLLTACHGETAVRDWATVFCSKKRK